MLAIFQNLGSLTLHSAMGVDAEISRGNKSIPIGPDGKKLKPCCACPETKKERDAW